MEGSVAAAVTATAVNHGISHGNFYGHSDKRQDRPQRRSKLPRSPLYLAVLNTEPYVQYANCSL